MKKLAYILLLMVVLAACTSDAYETGDTSLSYMRADMVDVRVVDKAVKSIVMDDDTSLPFTSSLVISNAKEGVDTTYRMMLYYNKVEKAPIEMLSNQPVMVFSTSGKADGEARKTHPLTLTSAWVSENGKYVNLSLGLKMGAKDENVKQKIGVVQDSVKLLENGNNHYFLTLCHDQNDIPQFYTQQQYVSISLRDCKVGDVISVDVNTYEGRVQRSFEKNK